MILLEIFEYYMGVQPDARSNSLPLLDPPYVIPITLVIYLFIIFVYGPRYMKNRKPYDLEAFRKCYNIFQIIFNIYIVNECIQAGWFTTITPFCEPPDLSVNPVAMKIVKLHGLNTIIKYIDLVETVVFVLRKKYNQITFLHMYHHVTTLLWAWATARYFPVAQASLTILVNCGIHVIMYTYYYVSTLGPNARRVLNKVKHILTIIQMTQFVVLTIHCLQLMLPSCQFPRIPPILFIINMAINFLFFANFYRQRYAKNAAKLKE